MRSRGALTWFAVDTCIHTSPKVVDLAAKLGLDLDTTVGKLCRLYAWAKTTGNESGYMRSKRISIATSSRAFACREVTPCA